MSSLFEKRTADNASETIASLNNTDSLSLKFSTNLEENNAAQALRLLREGVAAAKAGKRIEARQKLFSSIRLNENSEPAWMWLASISENPTELYDFLQRVLTINPDNQRALEWQKTTRIMLVNSLISRGAELAQENKRAQAAVYLRQATDYDPKNETAWLWLASVTDEAEDKLAYLQRILSLNPKNEKAASMFHAAKRQIVRNLLKKGSLAAVSGDRATARQILSEIMEYDSEVEEAWLLKAFLSETAREKAECFRRALEINPENVQAASGLASLQALQEQTVETESNVEETIEISECPFCGTENLADLVRCMGCKAFVSLNEAENLLVHDTFDDEAVRSLIERHHNEQNLDELTSEEHKNLALAYVNLKNFKKGATHFERAVELSEDDSLKIQLTEWLDKLTILFPEIHNEQKTSGKRIMVVDDSPTVRKLISSKLDKHGHQVIAAVDGIDALAKINEEKPDLILLDITMPRLDGYQLCKLVKNNPATKHIPVVMISGKDGFFDKVRGRMAGSTAYITKPFGPETLLQTVETYCK